MIAKIIPEKCIACGLCQLKAPDIFDYTDDGIVLFTSAPESQTQFIPEALTTQFMEAYKKCPTRAILVDEK